MSTTGQEVPEGIFEAPQEEVDAEFNRIVLREDWRELGYEYPWDNENEEWGVGAFKPDHFIPNADYGQPERTTVRLPNGAEIIDPFNLENLWFHNPEQIRRVLKEAEGEEAKYRDDPDHLVVINLATGGTIAMTKEDGENGALEPKVDMEGLMREIRERKREQFSISSAAFPTLIDSSRMKLDYLADIVIAMSWMWENMSPQLREKFGGFMITHGTDTVGDSGANLAMMLGPQCPFRWGLTAAQKTTEDRINDVGPNLENTLETLYQQHINNLNIPFIFMGGSTGKALPAIGSTKVTDREQDALQAPMHPPILSFKDFATDGFKSEAIDFWKKSSLHSSQTDSDFPNGFMPIIFGGTSSVKEVVSAEGLDAEVVGAETHVAFKLGKRIVQYVAFGSFTQDNIVLNEIKRAMAKRGILLATNPFATGGTEHDYKPAIELRQSGATITHAMPASIRAKVEIANKLFPGDLDAQKQFIGNNNYVGEVASDDMEKLLKNSEGVDTESTYSGIRIPQTGAPFLAKNAE